MGSRAEAVKKYKNYEIKWRKELKALKKQNNILFSIVNKPVSHRELNNIKKFRAKSSKKRRGDIRNSSS